MEPLTRAEVALLGLDSPRHPAQVGQVHLLDPGDDFDHLQLLDLVRDQLAFVPRFRQRIRPGGLSPVWVDDARFDLDFHVRRSALPGPGTMQQLNELCDRIMSQQLDRNRPLWELHLVEGLAEGRMALVTKTHLALVDGQDGLDLGQLLLEDEPHRPGPTPGWSPAPEPSPLDLLIGSAAARLNRPAMVVEDLQRGVASALGTAVAIGEATGAAGAVIGDLASAALTRAPQARESLLVGSAGRQRRHALVQTGLADLDRVREVTGHTLHDVILAVVAGGLADWLHAHRSQTGTVQALVPMAVVDDGAEPSALGCGVTAQVSALPVAQMEPLDRVAAIATSTTAHRDTGRSVPALSLTELAGFAPATLHALGMRVGQDAVGRHYDLLLTHAPGPRRRHHLGTASVVGTGPLVSLPPGHLLGVGVTTYDRTVTFGLTVDRDAIDDLDLLASSVADAASALVSAATDHHKDVR